MGLTDDIKTEDELLSDALLGERKTEEQTYFKRSLLGAGGAFFKDIFGNIQGRKDAEAKIALATSQIDDIKQKMATPVEVNIDDAEDKAVLDKLGRDISSAAAMNPTQSAQLFDQYEQLKEKSLDQSRIDAETARLKGEAEKTAALLPAKQDAEMQKLLAEQEKPSTLDDVLAVADAGLTLAGAAMPKTERRRQEDIAERKNKRAGNIAARIETRTAAGEDTTDLAAKLKSVRSEGQAAAKKVNTLTQQSYKRARARAGLGEPETFGTGLSSLMTPGDQSKVRQFTMPERTELTTPDLTYTGTPKFNFGTGNPTYKLPRRKRKT